MRQVVVRPDGVVRLPGGGSVEIAATAPPRQATAAAPPVAAVVAPVFRPVAVAAPERARVPVTVRGPAEAPPELPPPVPARVIVLRVPPTAPPEPPLRAMRVVPAPYQEPVTIAATVVGLQPGLGTNVTSLPANLTVGPEADITQFTIVTLDSGTY